MAHLPNFTNSLVNVIPKVHPKVIEFITRGVGYWTPPRISRPPHPNKMIAWVRGFLTGVGDQRFEYINQYHFTNIQDDYAVHPGPWSGVVAAPAAGEPGYTELLAVDDGTLYTGGVPNQVGRVQLQHANLTNMFFCDRYKVGFGVYDLTLTAGEIQDCIDWFYCPVTHNYSGHKRPNIVTHLGVDVTHEWTI